MYISSAGASATISPMSTTAATPKATATTANGWVRRHSSVGASPTVTSTDSHGSGRSSRSVASSTPATATAASSAQSRQTRAGADGRPGLVQHGPQRVAHHLSVGNRPRAETGRKADPPSAEGTARLRASRPMCRARRRRQRGGTGRAHRRRPITEESPCPVHSNGSAASPPAARGSSSGAGSSLCLLVVTSSAAFGRELDDPFEAPGLDSHRASRAAGQGGLRRRWGSARTSCSRPRDRRGDLLRLPRGAVPTSREVQDAVAALPKVLATSDPAGALRAGRQAAVESGVVSPDGQVALIRVQYPERKDLAASDLDEPQDAPRRPPRARRRCGSRPAATCTSRSSRLPPASARRSACWSRS